MSDLVYISIFAAALLSLAAPLCYAVFRPTFRRAEGSHVLRRRALWKWVIATTVTVFVLAILANMFMWRSTSDTGDFLDWGLFLFSLKLGVLITAIAALIIVSVSIAWMIRRAKH